jgi:hypothetical protein
MIEVTPNNISLDDILNNNHEYDSITFNIDYDKLTIELIENKDEIIERSIHRLSSDLKFKLALTHLSEEYVNGLCYHIIKANHTYSGNLLFALLLYNPNLINNKEFVNALMCYEIRGEVLSAYVYLDNKCRLYNIFKDLYPDSNIEEHDFPKVFKQSIDNLDDRGRVGIISGDKRVINGLVGNIMKWNNNYHPAKVAQYYQSYIEELKILLNFVDGVKLKLKEFKND